MSRTMIHVRLTASVGGTKEGGFTAANALDAFLTVVDLSDAGSSYRMGYQEPMLLEVWIVRRNVGTERPVDRPAAQCPVGSFEHAKGFCRGFDAGRASKGR